MFIIQATVNKKINDMSKQELIEQIAQILMLIKTHKGISKDSKNILKETLWNLCHTKEYKEYRFYMQGEPADWNLKPNFNEESEFDKDVKSRFKGI